MKFYAVELKWKVNLGVSGCLPRPRYFSTLRRAENYRKKQVGCESELHYIEIPQEIVRELSRMIEAKERKIERLKDSLEF